MFFGLTPEQQDYQHALRDFFRRSSTSADVRRLIGDEHGYDETVWRRMAAGNLQVQGLDIPEQCGGAGASFIELAIALEEAGYALAGGPLFASSVLASTCLQQSGDARAMAEYLPGIASGQKIATLAVADDNGAWDPAAFNGLKASRDGRDHMLSGTKSYVLDGGSWAGR